ncbi:hypothetical protein [Brevundimonas diminuta]|uniref:hypothetical protein n=1 Tax=Brevundimonas sp. CEF1 TaxID=3442642 RepID=UPI00289DCDF8|nr:hypothetical protein [Brevundimonas diminuta]
MIAPDDRRRLFNCQTNHQQPDWAGYRGLVLCGVCADKYGACLSCQPVDDAEFFTVYGVLATGECDAISDTVDGAGLDDGITLARDLAALSGLPLQFCRALPEGLQ